MPGWKSATFFAFLVDLKGDLVLGGEKRSKLGDFDPSENRGHVGGSTTGHFELIYKGNAQGLTRIFDSCPDEVKMTTFIGDFGMCYFLGVFGSFLLKKRIFCLFRGF